MEKKLNWLKQRILIEIYNCLNLILFFIFHVIFLTKKGKNPNPIPPFVWTKRKKRKIQKKVSINIYRGGGGGGS